MTNDNDRLARYEFAIENFKIGQEIVYIQSVKGQAIPNIGKVLGIAPSGDLFIEFTGKKYVNTDAVIRNITTNKRFDKQDDISQALDKMGIKTNGHVQTS